jgi:hypothetical protein
MNNFVEFFEPVEILTPFLVAGSPYTDINYTATQTACLVRYKKGHLQSGERISSGKNSITKDTMIQCYFAKSDEVNLSLNGFILWKSEVYKIIQIQKQEYTIEGVIVVAEFASENGIF